MWKMRATASRVIGVRSRFGSKATVVEILPRIVPLEDEEVSKETARAFRKRGIGYELGARFEVEQLPLADGRFHLRLGLTDEIGERLYHWLDDALAFVVYPAGDERGVVRLEGRWTGEEIGAPTERVAT